MIGAVFGNKMAKLGPGFLLTPYEEQREPHALQEAVIQLSRSALNDQLRCPVCLSTMTGTMSTMEVSCMFRKWAYTKCMHRFCSECISKSLRWGKKECPTCRKPCPSRRSLRADSGFDKLIQLVCPDRMDFEQQQEDVGMPHACISRLAAAAHSLAPQPASPRGVHRSWRPGAFASLISRCCAHEGCKPHSHAPRTKPPCAMAACVLAGSTMTRPHRNAPRPRGVHRPPGPPPPRRRQLCKNDRRVCGVVCGLGCVVCVYRDVGEQSSRWHGMSIVDGRRQVCGHHESGDSWASFKTQSPSQRLRTHRGMWSRQRSKLRLKNPKEWHVHDAKWPQLVQEHLAISPLRWIV